MLIAFHLALFLLAGTAIWLFSGIVIEAVEHVAQRYNKPGFGVAFFVLGFLTSIGEISVAINSTVAGAPEVSAGNLIGGSVVLFLFIIPALAVAGNGVLMAVSLSRRNLLFLLVLILLPALFTLDGNLNRVEGIAILILYAVLVRELRKREDATKTAKSALKGMEEELVIHGSVTKSILKVIGGAIFILLSGNLLVDETIFFSNLLGIPSSLIGLIILSVGTNIPELVIALRGVLHRKKDIALGNYLGSAAANTVVLGILILVNGTFQLPLNEFVPTFIILTVGLILFGYFSKSNSDISRREGCVLLALYGIFLLFQSKNFIDAALSR